MTKGGWNSCLHFIKGQHAVVKSREPLDPGIGVHISTLAFPGPSSLLGELQDLHVLKFPHCCFYRKDTDSRRSNLFIESDLFYATSYPKDILKSCPLPAFP